MSIKTLQLGDEKTGVILEFNFDNGKLGILSFETKEQLLFDGIVTTPKSVIEGKLGETNEDVLMQTQKKLKKKHLK